MKILEKSIRAPAGIELMTFQLPVACSNSYSEQTALGGWLVSKCTQNLFNVLAKHR